MSYGTRLGFLLGILLILVLFVVFTSLLFKYLIKSNKIKPSKVSRIFYTDDEKFIKNWNKNRKRGKFIYALYNFTIYSIVVLATSIIIMVVTGSDFNLPLFCGLLTGNIIGLPFSWNRNENKYYKLLNKK